MGWTTECDVDSSDAGQPDEDALRSMIRRAAQVVVAEIWVSHPTTVDRALDAAGGTLIGQSKALMGARPRIVVVFEPPDV